MRELILIKYGEIILKGLNRKTFEDKLVRNIKSSLAGVGRFKIIREQAVISIIPLEETADISKLIERLKKTFGIVYIIRAVEVEKNMDVIMEKSLEYVNSLTQEHKTFKVESKRSDKKFPLKSPEISCEVGAYILEGKQTLTVDVRNPDFILNVEVRDTSAYIYVGRTHGLGGLPTGVSGKATVLLSGGIDSPVAGWMIAKRGVELDAVHFHSHPYTSERAKEKVIELCTRLSVFCGKINLYIVPFTEIQLLIHEKCMEDQLTLIMRRFMMRIAEKIAINNGSDALITGESLAQVASQTIKSLGVTNDAVSMPVFRPLIGMDKEEIIVIARKIDTFETSILPYEDCCTIFVPKHPNTKPKLEKIKKSESFLDAEALIQKAVDETEVLEVKG